MSSTRWQGPEARNGGELEQKESTGDNGRRLQKSNLKHVPLEISPTLRLKNPGLGTTGKVQIHSKLNQNHKKGDKNYSNPKLLNFHPPWRCPAHVWKRGGGSGEVVGRRSSSKRGSGTRCWPARCFVCHVKDLVSRPCPQVVLKAFSTVFLFINKRN